MPCAGAYTLAGRIKPGVIYRDRMEIAHALAAIINTELKALVAAGAEVIIPAGGLPMLLFARERPFIIDEALVLNGIAVVAKAAEMALALRRLNGAVVSRRGTYAKASAA